MAARAALADLLAAGALHCRPTKWDRWCRAVATCDSGGVDLSAALLDAGMAYGFMLDDPVGDTGERAADYARREAAARKARAGLWREWLGD
jgi:endonuclease YncB( thermonuclease family)